MGKEENHNSKQENLFTENAEMTKLVCWSSESRMGQGGHVFLRAGVPSPARRGDQAAPKHKFPPNPNNPLSASMRISLTGDFGSQDISSMVLTA